MFICQPWIAAERWAFSYAYSRTSSLSLAATATSSSSIQGWRPLEGKDGQGQSRKIRERRMRKREEIGQQIQGAPIYGSNLVFFKCPNLRTTILHCTLESNFVVSSFRKKSGWGRHIQLVSHKSPARFVGEKRTELTDFNIGSTLGCMCFRAFTKKSSTWWKRAWISRFSLFATLN